MNALMLITAAAECVIAFSMYRNGTLALVATRPQIGATLAVGAALGAAFYGCLRRYPNTRIVPRRLTAAMFAYLIFCAVFEEIAFRGYALSVTTALFGGAAAALVTVLAFGLMHAQQGWFAIGIHVLSGLVFTLALLVTHDLWAAIAAHLTYNLLTARTKIVRVSLPLLRTTS